MARYPRCGDEVSRHKKEWLYRRGYYHVKSYYYPKCEKSFREYYHDGKLSHTIPKAK